MLNLRCLVIAPIWQVVLAICVGVTYLCNREFFMEAVNFSLQPPYYHYVLYKKTMYWSKYNILSHSAKFGYLLYNTISQSFIRIDENDIGEWNELKDNPDHYLKYQNHEYLLKNRIIVHNQEDELNVYTTEILKNRYNPIDMALTILPTRGCNFDCVYCYEQDRPNIHMDKQTEDNIIKFLKTNPYLRRLNVIWYGGEPLLNFASIVRLTEEFKSMGIEYSSKIITNGYLLSHEICGELERLKIDSIQITLDGIKDIHDQRRPLVSRKGSYDKIIQNVKYLLSVNSKIRIDIRSNIDKRNSAEYHIFFKQIHEELASDRIRTYPGFVSDLTANECVSPEFDISSPGFKADFVLDNFYKHNIAIDAFHPKYRRHSCVASKYFAFVIGPQGELYKCWRMVGNDEQTVGNVNNLTGINLKLISKYMVGADYLFDPECKECSYIAICGGGCALSRMRNKYKGSNKTPCCPEKTHMAKLLELRYEMYLKLTGAKG